MAAQILNSLLNEQRPINEIKAWCLSKENGNNDFPCTRGEFASYILNFIHEEARCFEEYRGETPKKVHTPKSIRKLELLGRPKRRSALFPAENHSPNTNSPRGRNSFYEDHNPSFPPVSPLYARFESPAANETTPRIRGKALCLGDYITPKKSTPNSDSKRTRRINPTNVAQRQSLNTENTYNFQASESSEQITPENISEKFKKLTTTCKLSSKTVEVEPDFSLVTSKNKLEILKEIYVHFIKSNVVLNVPSELYFVLTLLLTKQYESDYFTSEVFKSIHNIVYFAVECLKQLVSDLKLLDRASLRLLSSNERLKSLNGALAEELLTISETHPEITRSAIETSHTNVCFDSETDNRENFPNDQSFHAFRKQRDMFYEILHVWETNHTLDGWSFAVGLASRIKTLLAMHNEPANLRHLSRLFKSHLLLSQEANGSGNSKENVAYPTALPTIDAEKFNRLKNRLLLKCAASGINAPPSFTGVQEFCKEFITVAQSHLFCVHVQNAFVEELLGMLTTTESRIFDKDSFCTTVKTLQVLAKFIGYIESLPYNNGTMAMCNDKITLDEIASRSWMTPRLDLRETLRKSMEKGSLLLTIPWMVEYLSMLDGITLRLPYYEALYALLFGIFLRRRNVLIRCCLGWLFEQVQFPSEMYFSYLNECEAREGEEVLQKDCLDGCDIVDLDTLYKICPWLGEFKLLLQYNCNRSVTSKHVTPLMAIDSTEKNAEENEKRVKLQLEESYLSSKPSSLRKTLEFVSERVASCVVKTICNSVVHDVKAAAGSASRAVMMEFAHRDLNAEVKSDLKLKSTQLIDAHLAILRTECERTMTEQIDAKIYAAVEALLAADELEESIAVSVEIAQRMCRARVTQWITVHINTSVFKHIDMSVERVAKCLQKNEEDERKKKYKVLPVQGRPDVDHLDSDDEDEDAVDVVWNPSKLMTHLQRSCALLLGRPQQGLATRSEDVIRLVRKVAETQRRRCDLSDIAWHHINMQLVDYLLLLITHRPETMDDTAMEVFMAFWREHELHDDIFNGVISVRNVAILSTSAMPTVTWRLYGELLNRLLATRLVDNERFEAQCLSAFRENWDVRTLEAFCACLRRVVDAYPHRDRFATLLGFLADYCADLEF